MLQVLMIHNFELVPYNLNLNISCTTTYFIPPAQILFACFLATSAFFPLGVDLPLQNILPYVMSKWSSHGMVLPLIQRRLPSTL